MENTEPFDDDLPEFEATYSQSRSQRDRIEPPEPARYQKPEGDFSGERFLDREISWLDFNTRVLELAEDPDLYLLERANFLSIFASNLDEFFMVRVAGLKRRIAADLAVPTPAGLSPVEVLNQIHKTAHSLQVRHAKVLHDDILPALRKEGIHLVQYQSLSEPDKSFLREYFLRRIFPILTPLAVDPAHPFPYISGLSLNLAVLIRNPNTRQTLFARVKVPDQLPRLISLDGERPAAVPGSTARFIALEDVIAEHLDELFAGMEILEHHTFRVTRNEDLEVEEDDAENLLKALEKELMRRRFGPPVRLELSETAPNHIRELLIRELEVDEDEVFTLPEPLDLRGLGPISAIDRPELHYPAHLPLTSRGLKSTETSRAADVFEAMGSKDILLHHPYDSFATSVQAFLEQAAADPNVQAIKQTLYRTSGDSPIVDALIDAAEAGKQVLALVEIKARFDEEANISWARKLEEAGVHVVYGIVGLKTHCKLSLVVRQEGDQLRRYCHIGTGNYNPSTARYYEDLGLLTSDEQVGEDLSKLFNQLSGYAPRSTYNRLLVAPRSLRAGLLDRIENEINHAKAGISARIMIKANSLVDETLVDALYRASQAGVKVDVLIRGICALRPGVPGLSENIRVRSILGRFLEHSRLFVFHNAGSTIAYLGSADLMHRNLDRRVEALVRLVTEEDIAYLEDLIKRAMSDEAASWHLSPDGTWNRRHVNDEGTPLIDLQSWLIQQHRPAAVR